MIAVTGGAGSGSGLHSTLTTAPSCQVVSAGSDPGAPRVNAGYHVDLGLLRLARRLRLRPLSGLFEQRQRRVAAALAQPLCPCAFQVVDTDRARVLYPVPQLEFIPRRLDAFPVRGRSVRPASALCRLPLANVLHVLPTARDFAAASRPDALLAPAYLPQGGGLLPQGGEGLLSRVRTGVGVQRLILVQRQAQFVSFDHPQQSVAPGASLHSLLGGVLRGSRLVPLAHHFDARRVGLLQALGQVPDRSGGPHPCARH